VKNSLLSSSSDHLPVTRDLALACALSLVAALLMAVASVAGLLYTSSVYPTQELIKTFVANDVANLLIGLPILLGSMWLARRGKLMGLLFWPGALFYALYNYIVYVLGTPLALASLLYLALVTLSAYALFSLVASIDGQVVQQRLAGAVPERFAGGVLTGLGALFFLRVIGVIVNALIHQTLLARTELALHVADLIIAPAWVIGGILLWRRQVLGYVTGMGLLFQASMLFVGLIFFLILQPFLTTAPFVLADVVAITIMGMVCFVPFALFVRGAASQEKQNGPIKSKAK
jgi:hypothetical protein